MKAALLLSDTRHVMLSQRTAYSAAFMVMLAVVVALVANYSPENLKAALQAGAPGSAGIFEYMWFDIMTLFLPLVIVGYGAFILSDLEDQNMMGLVLTRPESRLAFLSRRVVAATVSFIIFFLGSCVIVAGIAMALVGNLRIDVFLEHQIMLFPLFLFILGLTFLASVGLRTTTPTVLTSFAICLVLYFAYSLLMTSGSGLPSSQNPMALGYRILAGAPFAEPALISVGYACAFFAAGSAWFARKDL